MTHDDRNYSIASDCPCGATYDYWHVDMVCADCGEDLTAPTEAAVLAWDRLRDVLSAAHAADVGTGGGCRAYRVDLPDQGRYLLVTDDDANLPGFGTRVDVGVYDRAADEMGGEALLEWQSYSWGHAAASLADYLGELTR